MIKIFDISMKQFITQAFYRNSYLIIFIFLCNIHLFTGCASLTSTSYTSRIKAVKRTSNQKKLLTVAINDNTWIVRNAAFDKLNDKSLSEISNLTYDQAIIIASKIRLKQTTWEAEFSDSFKPGVSLGNLIGAAALVDSPQPPHFEIVSACHKFIKQGDASRIPELISLLNRFGDKTLAEDFMNCGNYDLKEAGEDWGRAHGYNVRTGQGSNRVRWGGK